MPPIEELTISITAGWNDWRSAEVRLDDLCDVHWHQPSGAPRAMVCASISCANIAGSRLSHACDPATAPHLIPVCILRSRNVAASYAEAVRRADCVCVPSSSSSEAGAAGTTSPAVGGWSHP